MDARMGKLIVNRLGFGVLTLFVVSLVVFTLTVLLPGDPAPAPIRQGATATAASAPRATATSDALPHQRYVHWLGGMLTGDLGYSRVQNRPVNELLATRLPNSLMLVVATAILSIPLGLALGIVSAMRRGSVLDRVLSLGALSVAALPEFVIAAVVALLFAVTLGGVAVGSPVGSPVLPVVTLCGVIIAQMARMTRITLVELLSTPYGEMAMLKGGRPSHVVLAHALPNAAGPLAAAAAVALSYLLSGVVIVETVFGFPGAASLMVVAVAQHDMPVVQACAMIFSAAYLAMVLLADLTAFLSNPRLRHA